MQNLRTRDLQTIDIEFNVYFKNLIGIFIVTKKELCLYGIECNSAACTVRSLTR